MIAPAEAFKSAVREARAALSSGELDGLDEPDGGLAALVERAAEDAVGAPADTVATLASALAEALGERRRRVRRERHEMKRRVTLRLALSADQERRAAPDIAARLRRARREALEALAPAQGEARLATLKTTAAALDEAALAAPPSRAAGAETLPHWIATVEALLARLDGEASGVGAAAAEAGRGDSGHVAGRGTWATRLDEARHAGDDARTAAAAAAALVAAADEIEAILAQRFAATLHEAAGAHAALLDLLLDADLAAEERFVLEAARDALNGGAGGAMEQAQRAVAAVSRAVESRRARARLRLEEALAAAHAAGVDRQHLAPSAAGPEATLAGTSRLLAGAARLEAIAAEPKLRPLLPRVAGALESARAASARASSAAADSGSQAVRHAAADLRIRLAAESPDAIEEALGGLEALIAAHPAAPGRDASPAAPPAVAAEDAAAFAAAHPIASAALSDLRAWATTTPSSTDASDLIEQAALEARSLRDAALSIKGGTA